MGKNNKEIKDIYAPFTKNDFRKVWFNFDTERIEPFKIIRQCTNEEKQGFEQGDDYDEEMYLIQNQDGEEYTVFDINILDECELSHEQKYLSLLHFVESLEFDEVGLDDFIKKCKIEKYIYTNN